MDKKVILAAEKFERFIFLLTFALEWYSYMKSTKQDYEDSQVNFGYDNLRIELSAFIFRLVVQPRCEDLIVIDPILSFQVQEQFSYITFAFKTYVKNRRSFTIDIVERLIPSFPDSTDIEHRSLQLYRLYQREVIAFSLLSNLDQDLKSEFEFFFELRDIFDGFS